MCVAQAVFGGKRAACPLRGFLVIAQLLREGAVVINKRIGRAGSDERGRIVAQVGSRRAGVRVRPVLTVDLSAADEPDEGGIIDDAKRREALERLVLLEEEIRDRGEQHRGSRR